MMPQTTIKPVATPRPGLTQNRWLTLILGAPRQLLIAGILILALFAFEIFNFDTTKYALQDLLGHVNFAGFGWAGILAFAFCAIDFAGLVRIFTPQTGRSEPREVWYLMGAWLLGATMNAMMTWYAVALTLVNRPGGHSEVLTPDQLQLIVPIFVAVLVWLTRILFIGSLSVAGEQMFMTDVQTRPAPRPTMAPVGMPAAVSAQPSYPTQPMTQPVQPIQPVQATNPGRVRQRPPMTKPLAPQVGRPTPAPMSAKSQR